MFTGEDVLLLIRLAAISGAWTFRSLGGAIGMDPALLHRRVARLRGSRLLDEDRNVNRANTEEFLVHAVRFIVPGHLGEVVRGEPTAWGRRPLMDLISADSGFVPVWPDPHGKTRGPRVDPISADAPRISREDPVLGEWLALIDALRVGRARERKLSADELHRRIWGDVG